MKESVKGSLVGTRDGYKRDGEWNSYDYRDKDRATGKRQRCSENDQGTLVLECRL